MDNERIAIGPGRRVWSIIWAVACLVWTTHGALALWHRPASTALGAVFSTATWLAGAALSGAAFVWLAFGWEVIDVRPESVQVSLLVWGFYFRKQEFSRVDLSRVHLEKRTRRSKGKSWVHFVVAFELNGNTVYSSQGMGEERAECVMKKIARVMPDCTQ